MNTLQDKIRPRKMRYVIDGDPVALARPRFGKTHVYDSQKQLRMISRITIQSQHDGFELFTGPLRMEMNFYLNYSSKKNANHLEGMHHTRVPDLDNLIKYICDIASGTIYEDDRIVCSIHATKWFSREPRTEITVLEL